MKRNISIIILAAGKGTRMYSDAPKVLHTVCGRSMLLRVIDAVSVLSPEKIVVVVGYGAEAVQAELQGISNVETVLQAEQNGTGHAVQCALSGAEITSDEVLILPGDVPLIDSKDLLTLCESKAGNAVSFLTCDHPAPAMLGRVVRDDNGDVEAIVEYKDCSEKQKSISEINSSVYLASKDFLEKSVAALKNNNAQKELYLTDIVAAASKDGGVVACKVENYFSLSGANNRYELHQLEAARRAEIVKELMVSGVTIEDPSAVYIDEGVVVEPDTYLGAGTRLRGSTKILSGAVIEGNSLIVDSSVGAGTNVKLSCYIEESTIEANCNIGPYAHLRPGSVLKENVKVGNFVETKKVTLEAGAKANHLTYLGDAHVGEAVNIGAGTITCNYDGYNKFKTEIKAGAFIGSNTALVAPVVVGEGAIIGAGSTISKDVPADALVVERAKERTLEGWAAQKRKKEEK
jgi:bifunctional UDP-N-acetylglucosamine pyrophosphorylase/glucosamine-1-phosphate N-acetyltransferase